jgi:hypothetical protein
MPYAIVMVLAKFRFAKSKQEKIMLALKAPAKRSHSLVQEIQEDVRVPSFPFF